jgi:hypothetical protein
VIANDVPGDERALVRTARWAWPTALCVAVTLIVGAVVLFVVGPVAELPTA